VPREERPRTRHAAAVACKGDEKGLPLIVRQRVTWEGEEEESRFFDPGPCECQEMSHDP